MTALADNTEQQTRGADPAGLLRALLAESRELTAVERFAKAHDDLAAPEQAKYYRDLIPAAAPGAGQQYAFDVDLDACSGCKACVSACHHLNGLDPTETWRSVGQLHGENGLPVIQHVTTACHHCVDPGCLNGCPTNAYEKDPVTGIVRHLDDQCFGCQYCTMACPYEVPQYSPSKGIVRKCDMCHGRLAAGEAPACVQACPNQAIRITTVEVAETVARTDRGLFLPDSPPSHLTNPTTVYRTERGLPTNTVGFDADHAEPQHAHAPLVGMLVMTQLSVGAVAVAALAGWLGAGAWADAAVVLGMLAGQAGLAVAPLHLGRPHLAFRAVLGWRHSWLSREAAMFGVYAAFSVLAAVLAALPHFEAWIPSSLVGLKDTFLPAALRRPAEALAILAGLVSIYCSAKIYLFTGRSFWRSDRTFAKFFGTALVLGPALAAAVMAVGTGAAVVLSVLTVFLAIAKASYEALFLAHAKDTEGDLRLSAGLQLGPLAPITAARFAGVAVGVPCFLGAAIGVIPFVLAPIGFAALLAGELAERWLYFSTVVPLRMPGGMPTR